MGVVAGSPLNLAEKHQKQPLLHVVNKPLKYQDESNAVFLPKNTQKNISQTSLNTDFFFSKKDAVSLLSKYIVS